MGQVSAGCSMMVTPALLCKRAGGAQKRNPADSKGKKPKPAPAEGKLARGDSAAVAAIDARLRPAQKSPLGLPPLPSLLQPQQQQQQAPAVGAPSDAAAAAPQASAPVAQGLQIPLCHPLARAAPACLYAKAATPRAAAAGKGEAKAGAASVGTVQPPDAAQPLPFLSPITVGRAPDAQPPPPPACARARCSNWRSLLPTRRLRPPRPSPPPAAGETNGGSPLSPSGARPRGRPSGSSKANKRGPGRRASADSTHANGRANGGGGARRASGGARAAKRARGRPACNGRQNGRSETPEEEMLDTPESSFGQPQEESGSDVDADIG